MGVNSLPKTVTRQRRGCDLNPDDCFVSVFTFFAAVKNARYASDPQTPTGDEDSKPRL